MDTAAAEIRESRANGIQERLGSFFELTKPRIAFMLVLTSAAGFYLGSGPSFDLTLFVNSMLAITLLAFGVATLNQYIERDIDALMERTAKRPIPSGRVSPTEALVFGILLCVGAEIYLFVAANLITAVLGMIVIAGYVLLYTPLKTKTPLSTAVGAVPGAIPPLIGWTAASNEITLGAWFLFSILFLWQFPHFLAIAWMYKDQYAKAGIKMLPVVDRSGIATARQIVLFTLFLVPISLAPFFLGISGIYFLIGAIVLGIWFLFVSIQAARTKSVTKARKLLLASVLYLPIIFGLMVFNH